MAIFSIYDLVKYQGNDDELKTGTFMFGDYYDAPEEGEDVRPVWAKLYVDTVYATAHQSDFIIGEKYKDYYFVTERDTIERAYNAFKTWAVVWTMTHRTELDMIAKAFTTDFNPLENYDRYEELKRRSRGKSEASNTSGSKTSPDFVAAGTTFYDTAQIDGGSEGKSCAKEMANNHIHGNIGVTQATDMLDNAVTYFNNNSLYDTLLDKIIGETCIIIV